MAALSGQAGTTSIGRIAAIDLARGIALVAMIVYHFAFDLRLNGLIAVDVATDPGWVLLARATAGTFLFLVGVNLVLATRRGIRPWPFLHRLGLIAGGAALVSLATWLLAAFAGMGPQTFVFFGILHAIAVGSVFAIPFLQAPPYVTAITGALVLFAPLLVALPIDPALWWVGLSTSPPRTIDYVPIFPWFGVILVGVVAGRVLVDQGAERTLARWQPVNPIPRFVIRAGQWTLLIYILHQPILFGALWVAAPYVSPERAGAPVLAQSQSAERAAFMGQCVPACRVSDRSEATCAAFCTCMFDGLHGTDLYTVPAVELMQPEQRQRWDAIVNACAAPTTPAQ